MEGAGILQLCSSDGRVFVERTTVTEEGLEVEGVLQVHMIYITSDDGNPVASWEELMPFSQLVEVPGISPKVRYRLQACLEQLTTVLLDAGQVEVKATIDLNTILFLQEPLLRLVSLQEETPNLQKLEDLPGMVGYLAKAGDRCWDIAKEHHTTCQLLWEMNPELEGVTRLQGGEKLLIVKQVG